MKKFLPLYVMALCLFVAPALASDNLARLNGTWTIEGGQAQPGTTLVIDARNKAFSYDNGKTIHKGTFTVVLDEGDVISLQERESQDAARFTFQDNDTVHVRDVIVPDRQATMKRVR